MGISNGLCMGCMSEIGSEPVCPSCGYDNSNPDNGQGLPIRTMLSGKYMIGRVLDSGGEGITYIGKDISTGKIVRIREFFPTGICERNADGTLSVEREKAFTFNESLICFVELAKSLAGLGPNPHLLPIIDIFEAGGTAYYITESTSGITLREFLLRNGGQLTFEQARSLFLPLMPTLTLLHENNIIHRGISPETLLVGRDGKIRITGFCIAAARTARSEISARLFPGFAAIEQYGFDAKPGPWTDVYGLAATIFRTLIGNPPPEATERVSHDNMTIPAKLAEQIPKKVLVTIANALQVMPENRIASIEELRQGLMVDPNPAVAPIIEDEPPAKPSFFKQYGVLIVSGIAAIVIIAVAFFIFMIMKNNSQDSGNKSNSTSSSSSTGELLYNPENRPAEVIPFLGKTPAEVEQYYIDEGFEGIEVEIAGRSYNNKYALGQIYRQKQEIGLKLSEGEKIEVYVSLGAEKVVLPDFVEDKYDYRDARIKLLELGFAPDNIIMTGVKMEDNKDPYKVYEVTADADANKMVDINSIVKLYYYKPVEQIQVDSFVGKNYYTDIEGNSKYNAYDFKIVEEYYVKYEKGLIVSQDPPRGTTIKSDQKVTLTISAGKPPSMPSGIVGQYKNEVLQYFESRNIQYSVVQEYSDTVKNGYIIRATPSAGTLLDGSITVVLYISKGKKPVAPPAESNEPSSSEAPSDETPSTETPSTDSSVSNPSSETPSTDNSDDSTPDATGSSNSDSPNDGANNGTEGEGTAGDGTTTTPTT